MSIVTNSEEVTYLETVAVLVEDNEEYDGPRSFELPLSAMPNTFSIPVLVTTPLATVYVEDDECLSGEVSVCV